MHRAPSTSFPGKACNPTVAAGKSSPSSEWCWLWPPTLRLHRKRKRGNGTILQGHLMHTGSATLFPATSHLSKKVKKVHLQEKLLKSPKSEHEIVQDSKRSIQSVTKAVFMSTLLPVCVALGDSHRNKQ